MTWKENLKRKYPNAYGKCDGHKEYRGIHDLLSLLLQFPRLETLRVEFLEMYRSSKTEIQSGKMIEAIREFLDLQTFKKNSPKLLQLASVQQGLQALPE